MTILTCILEVMWKMSESKKSRTCHNLSQRENLKIKWLSMVSFMFGDELFRKSELSPKLGFEGSI